MSQYPTRFAYFVMQRILRVNSRVPWPVHFASLVNAARKIQRASASTRPGWMPMQYIQANNGIFFGKNVRLEPGVKVVSASHQLDDFDRHDAREAIRIGDNCWIGADAVILPGVSLGSHVVVQEGSVVTKDFPDNCEIGGVPAVKLRDLGPYQGKVEE